MNGKESKLSMSPYNGMTYMQSCSNNGKSCVLAYASEIRNCEISSTHPGITSFEIEIAPPKSTPSESSAADSIQKHITNDLYSTLADSIPLNTTIELKREQAQNLYKELKNSVEHCAHDDVFSIRAEKPLDINMLTILIRQAQTWFSSGNFEYGNINGHRYGLPDAYFGTWINDDYCTFACNLISRTNPNLCAVLNAKPLIPNKKHVRISLFNPITEQATISNVLSLPKNTSLSSQLLLNKQQIHHLANLLMKCADYPLKGAIFTLRGSMHFNRKMLLKLIKRLGRWFEETPQPDNCRINLRKNRN